MNSLKEFVKERPILHMKESRINVVDNIRYLGVDIDEQLCFGTHIGSLADKINKTITNLGSLVLENNGFSCLSLRTFIKG